MTQVNFTIDGLKELNQDFKGLESATQNSILRSGLHGGIRPVVKLAKRYVPRRTGGLARSLVGKVKVMRGGQGVARVIARRKGFRGYHAAVTELGSSTQAARPFFRPAFDEAVSSGLVRKAFVEAINKAVSRRRARMERRANTKEFDVKG